MNNIKKCNIGILGYHLHQNVIKCESESIYFLIHQSYSRPPWSTFKVVALVNLCHHLSWVWFAKLYLKWSQHKAMCSAQCSETNHPQSNVDSPNSTILGNSFHNFYQVVQFWPNFTILKFRFSCFVLWEWARTRPQVLPEIV